MDETSLQWICSLAQIELSPNEKKSLIRDVEKLLEHFSVLSELPKKKPDFQTRRIFLREDIARQASMDMISGIKNNFPDQNRGMLKISALQPEAPIGE